MVANKTAANQRAQLDTNWPSGAWGLLWAKRGLRMRLEMRLRLGRVERRAKKGPLWLSVFACRPGPKLKWRMKQLWARQFASGRASALRVRVAL